MSNFFEKAIAEIEKESTALANVVKAVVSHLSPETKAKIDQVVTNSEQITQTANEVLKVAETVIPIPQVAEAEAVTAEAETVEKEIGQVVQ